MKLPYFCSETLEKMIYHEIIASSHEQLVCPSYLSFLGNKSMELSLLNWMEELDRTGQSAEKMFIYNYLLAALTIATTRELFFMQMHKQ